MSITHVDLIKSLQSPCFHYTFNLILKYFLVRVSDLPPISKRFLTRFYEKKFLFPIDFYHFPTSSPALLLQHERVFPDWMGILHALFGSFTKGGKVDLHRCTGKTLLSKIFGNARKYLLPADQ